KRVDRDWLEADEILEDLRSREEIYYKKLPVIVLTQIDKHSLSEELKMSWKPLDFISKPQFERSPGDLIKKIFNLLQTVARYFVECLHKQGVRRVYGIPGTEVLEIIHAIRETQEAGVEKIEYILTGHEQGAAFMANGAGRVNENRVPGVCLATLGPGATNLMTGIADAYEDKSSVVVITGQAPSRRFGKESHQAENTLDMFTSFTKYRKKIESSDATEISSAVAKAFDIARGENPGPVLLEVPNDIAESIVTNYVDPVDPFRNQNTVKHRDIVPLPAATDDMIDEAVRRIKEAERPIIIAGSGANRAAQNAMRGDYTIHKMLTELVDKFRIPITTTFMGKGSIPSNHPLCLPVVGCRQDKNDYDLANVALDAADLVITVGYDFFEFESDIWNFYRRERDKTNIINISFAPPQIDYCYNPDLILLGSITTNLETINEKLAAEGYQCANAYWLESVVEQLKEMHAEEFKKYLSDKSKLTPHQVIDTVRECLDKPSDILVSDGGFHKMVTARFYETYRPNTCLIPNGFSTVGYALPIAIGVKMEHPERRIVATIGDGGFMMNNQELATAVHYKKNIVVIILKDGYHGLIKIKNANKYPVGIEDAVKLPDVVRFADLAKSMGALGKDV
ncbi:MAG: thiamine pyrophosphate-dependent enzyme, partial [Candidatus Poribacteria bacterium]